MEKLLTYIGYNKDIDIKKRAIYIIAAIGISQLCIFFPFYILVAYNKWLIIESVIIMFAYLSVFPLLKFGHFTVGKIIVIMGLTIQVIFLVFVWFPTETYFVLFFFIVPPISFFVLDIGLAAEKKFLSFTFMSVAYIIQIKS